MTIMASVNDPIVALEEHWAVSTFRAAERAALAAHAEDVIRGLRGAAVSRREQPPPEQLLALASAFDIAARERLDLEGLGSPLVSAPADELAHRRAFLRFGAARAFALLAAAPLDFDDDVGALYRTLLLAGMAQVGGTSEVFRLWLSQQQRVLFPGEDADLRWDLLLLRRIVELWTEVLSGTGPSGLERAMEIVATIREERGLRERELLASFDEPEEMRMRFYLFALFHLTEGATELLLFRLHGEPDDIRQRLFVSLTLAGEATAGDARIHAALDWLYEAGVRVVSRRTPQLDLLASPLTSSAHRPVSSH